MDDALIDRIKRSYELFNAGDEYDLDFFHPDVEWQNAPGFPGGGLHHGRDAVVADMAAQAEAWEGRRIEIHEVIPAGNQVLVDLTMHAQGKTSGIPVTIHLIHLWTLADGKVRRVEVFIDRRAALKAAGLER